MTIDFGHMCILQKVEHIGVLNGGWRRDASFPVPKNHWQQSKEGGDSIVESFLGVDSSPTVDVQVQTDVGCTM